MYIYLYKSIYERQTDGQEARLVEGRAGVPLLLSFCALVSLRPPPTSSSSSPVAPLPQTQVVAPVTHSPCSYSDRAERAHVPLNMPKDFDELRGITIKDSSERNNCGPTMFNHSFSSYSAGNTNVRDSHLVWICMLYYATFSLFSVSNVTRTSWSFVNLLNSAVIFSVSQLNIQVKEWYSDLYWLYSSTPCSHFKNHTLVNSHGSFQSPPNCQHGGFKTFYWGLKLSTMLFSVIFSFLCVCVQKPHDFDLCLESTGGKER